MQLIEYTPNSRMRKGSVRAMVILTLQVWNHRSQTVALFTSQWRGLVAGTGLGVIWNYLLPLVPLSVYALLAQVRVFPAFEGVEPLAAITFGVTLWFLFAGMVQVPLNTVATKRSESLKTSFPLICSIASSYAQLLFDSAIRALCVAAVLLALGTQIHIEALLLPLVLLPAFLLFSAFGLLLSVLNTIYRDVGRVTGIALQYGLFLSGVIFPLDRLPTLEQLNAWNPFALFIDVARDLFFLGELDLIRLAVPALASIVLVPLSTRLFYVMEERIKD